MHFTSTSTSISKPAPPKTTQVNLQTGVEEGETQQTNLAAAGSLVLEFTLLSRLTGDCRFEQVRISIRKKKRTYQEKRISYSRSTWRVRR